MNIIKLKKDGKTFHQFIVPDLVLNLAEKLGISKDQYIIEQAKVELEERKVNEHNHLRL
jgi:plasmid maintenance system antidote protein VapI